MCNYSTEKVFVVSDIKTASEFALFIDNRAIRPLHVKEIKKAILEGKKMPNIIVDLQSKKVIDGQHRLEAVRQILEEGGKASIRVVFENCETEVSAMEFAHDINANQKGWTDKDYVNYWKDKKDVYNRLVEFAKEHSLCYGVSKTGKSKGEKNLKLTTAARLIMGPSFQRSAIRDGKFTAKDRDFARANQYHDELKKILMKVGKVTEEKNLPNMGNSFESMITGWINFRNETYPEMENAGGFSNYVKFIHDNLDMSVCTVVKEWQERFYDVLEKCA